MHERAEYAGNTFKTEAYQLKKQGKNDDSHVRYDCLDANGDLESAFATVTRIFVHQLYPEGPTKIVIKGSWFKVVAKCEITGNPLVRPDPRYYPEFAFLQTCYQQPVALWPRNPVNQSTLRCKDTLEVIDYNQEQQQKGGLF